MTSALSKSEIKRACDILRMDDGVGAGAYVEQLSWLLFLRVFELVEEQLEEISKEEGRKYIPVIDPEYRWSSWAKKDWKHKDELVQFVNQDLFPHLKELTGTPEKQKIRELFLEFTNRIHNPQTILNVADILNPIDMGVYQDTHLLSQVYEEILQEMGTEGGWSGEFYTPRPIIKFMVDVVNPKLGEKILDPFAGSCGFLIESFKHIYGPVKETIGLEEWNKLQKNTFYGQEKKPLPFLIGNMNMILHKILVPNIIRTNTLSEDVHNIPEGAKFDVILTNPPFGGKEPKSVRNNYPIQVTATEALSLQYVMRKLKNGGKCGIVIPESDIVFGKGKYASIRENLFNTFNVHTIVSLPKGTFKQVGADVTTYLFFFEKTGKTKQVHFVRLEGNYTKQNAVTDKDLELLLDSKEPSKNSKYISFEQLKENNYDISLFSFSNNHEKPTGLIDKSSKIKELVDDFYPLKELIERDTADLSSFEVSEYKLSDLIIRNKTIINLKDTVDYKRVTIRMHGLGIEIRDVAKGSKIGTKKQFLIKEGQLLLSKIDARNGAVGIVPNDCDGAIITGNFWAYDINEFLILPKFFKVLLGTHRFTEFFDRASRGLTNRRYLQEDLFLDQDVSIPDLETQKHLVNEFDQYQEFQRISAKISDLIGDYLQIYINEIIE